MHNVQRELSIIASGTVHTKLEAERINLGSQHGRFSQHHYSALAKPKGNALCVPAVWVADLSRFPVVSIVCQPQKRYASRWNPRKHATSVASAIALRNAIFRAFVDIPRLETCAGSR